MEKYEGKIGVIAGSGQMPLLVVEEAVARHPAGAAGVFAVCVTEDAYGRLRDRVYAERVSIGQASKAIKLLKKNAAQACVFAGKVDKVPVLAGLAFDARAIKILARARDFSDHGLMTELVKELEAESIRVLLQTDVLRRYVTEARVYTKRKPTRKELEDVRYGLEKARRLAALGIGQTVVVRNKAILAAEAAEGTDETIRRGARIADGSGGVVVKAMMPGQDARFDVPTVGLATLKVVLNGNLKVLALEAGCTFFIDQPEAVAAANGGGVTVMGISA